VPRVDASGPGSLDPAWFEAYNLGIMTISEIRVYTAPLAARSTYNMSNSTVSTPEATIVEVVDSDGTIGYGEACLASPQFQPAHNDGVRSSLSVLAPAIIGLDPLKLNLVNAAMAAFTRLSFA